MKNPVPTDRMLICLLFWEGDKKQCFALAKLIADLEDSHSSKADLLFVSRFDCKHDMDAIRAISRKFNVYTHTSKRRGTGWPMGCNSLFFGTLEWVYYKMAGAQIPHYRSVLILGADTVPLNKNWIDIMRNAFEENGRPCISGALIKDPVGGHDHINGDCALLTGDLNFLKWLTLEIGDISVQAGWDWVLSKEFERRGWCNFPFVTSYWNRPVPFTQEDWEREQASGTVMFHGQKGFSLLNIARKNLL